MDHIKVDIDDFSNSTDIVFGRGGESMESISDLIEFYSYSNIFITKQWLVRVSGFVSTVSSIWMLYDIVQSGRDRNIGLHILILMTISDIMSSLFSYVLGTIMVPKGLAWGAVGNEITCLLQGLIGLTFTFSSSFYNATLAIYYLLVVKYGWNKRRFQTLCCRFWMLVFPLLFCTIYCTLVLFDDAIHYEGGQACFLNPYPVYCGLYPEVVGECTKGKHVNLFTAFALLCFIIFFVSIFVSMVLLWKFVRGTEQKQARHNFRGMPMNDNTKKSVKAARVGVLFCLSFFIVNMFPFWGHIYQLITGEDWPTLVNMLNCIFSPLQGFFNAFIYAYRYDLEIVQNMRNCIKKGVQRCRFKSKTSEETRSNVQTMKSVQTLQS